MKTFESRYRDKMDLVIKFDQDYVIEKVGLDTLVEQYIAYVAARQYASKADAKDAPDEIEVEFSADSSDEIPLYKSGSRAGKPTELDIKRGKALWGKSVEEIEVKLETWSKRVSVPTYEELNESDDPEMDLAKIARAIRLDIERERKRSEADELGL